MSCVGLVGGEGEGCHVLGCWRNGYHEEHEGGVSCEIFGFVWASIQGVILDMSLMSPERKNEPVDKKFICRFLMINTREY